LALCDAFVLQSPGMMWNEFGTVNFTGDPGFNMLQFTINSGCIINCTTPTMYVLQATTDPLTWTGTVSGEFVRPSDMIDFTLIRRPFFQHCPQSKQGVLVQFEVRVQI
jgi:hypothetical protein